MKGGVRARQVVLLAVVLAAIFGHAATDHAHADPWSTVPVSGHVPGDAHHDVPASCAALKAPAPVALPAATPATVDVVPWRQPAHLPGLSERTVAGRTTRPLFLLHATLLI